MRAPSLTVARSARLILASGLLVAATACDTDKIAEMLYGQPPAPEGADCSLSLDGLAGHTFVMAEAMPGGEIRNNPVARAKFYEEEGKLKVKYTVKSVADVYTYECRKIRDGKEWECREEPRLQDWCQALETHEAGLCTAKKLEELGADGISTPEELAAAVKAGKETVAKYRDAANDPKADEQAKANWEQFRLNNNNLGNKLQGLLFAKVNDKRCVLSVTDMYMTIFDGKQKKDSNPVGTNDFALDDAGTYLWEHCDDGRSLLDLAIAERPPPGEVPPKQAHEVGKPVYYQYYGEKEIKAEEGCTYSYDAYAQWQPAQQGVAVTPGEEGELIWSAQHTFADDPSLEYISKAKPIGMFAMVRNKTCGGKTEKIDTVCNVAQVMNP